MKVYRRPNVIPLSLAAFFNDIGCLLIPKAPMMRGFQGKRPKHWRKDGRRKAVLFQDCTLKDMTPLV